VSVNIDNVYNKLANDIRANPSLGYNLSSSIQKIVHIVQMHFVQKIDDGYCSKFTIPDRDLNNIFMDFPNVTDVEIKNAFAVDWGVPPAAHMHNNIYYHRLLLIMLHAAKTNNDALGYNALSLILFRIWNGRLCLLIKWCNSEIMRAAVSKINTKLVRQYQHPLDLVQDYFAKTIYIKYKPYVLRDSVETKRTFEQCHNRVKQLFGSNNQIDLETGKTRYQTGLQPEYYRAHKDRNRISIIGNDPDSDDKFSTSSDLESTIDHVSRFISTYKQVTYDVRFIQMVTSNVKGFSVKSVSDILEKMHKLKYYDILREIVEIIYRRLRGITQQEMCSQKAYDYLKTRIISSKNTRDVEFLKQITDKLLDQIFKNDFNDKSYDTYLLKSDNHRSQIRSVIFYGIIYNIQKATCEYK